MNALQRRARDWSIPPEDRHKNSRDHVRLVREPTVSLAEAAERLHTTVPQLAGLMRWRPQEAPAVVLDCKSRVTKERRRYHMSDFKRWWPSVQPKKESV